MSEEVTLEQQVSDLQALMDKIIPETKKVPQVESAVQEIKSKLDGLGSYVEGLKAKELKAEESRRKEDERLAEEGRKEIEITIPEVALEHYAACPNCKPKFNNWLTEHGYSKASKVEPAAPEGGVSESATPETGTKPTGRLRALDWKHGKPRS